MTFFCDEEIRGTTISRAESFWEEVSFVAFSVWKKRGFFFEDKLKSAEFLFSVPVFETFILSLLTVIAFQSWQLDNLLQDDPKKPLTTFYNWGYGRTYK